MTDLVAFLRALFDFLRAQFDEDEQVAYAAGMQLVDESDAKWVAHGQRLGEHISRHDPARALREVKAKRLRVAEIERELADDPTNETARWLLSVEALPYSDHPDYRSEWAVTP